MKKVFTFLAVILMTAAVIAQTPEKISYQAVVRNSKGALVTNQTIGMQISIYYYVTGVERQNVYVETQTTVTNENGLLSIEIGNGTVVEGALSIIDWGAQTYYIQTEMDPEGGEDYTIVAETQLTSVPYALHSKVAETISGSIKESDPTWEGTADLLSPIGRKGNVGIGITMPAASLHVYGREAGTGNILFVGDYKYSTTPGEPPDSGQGTRMMWYPDKAAFRAGYVKGREWDKDSIGLSSIALGFSTKAKGSWATALGSNTNASGFRSTALGSQTTALGDGAMALGNSTTASGDFSTSMGIYTTASGFRSTAIGVNSRAQGDLSTSMGLFTTAHSYCETVIGTFNSSYTPVSTTEWNNADRLFVVGNGSSNSPKNALTILKSGYMGILTITPTVALDVNGNGRFRAIGSGAYSGALNRTSDGTLTTATSDIRLKENVKTLKDGLDKVMQLRGVSFTWKSEPEAGTRIGLIAQELEEVIPELVFTNPTDGYKGVNYAELTAVLIEAIKEQQKQINDLKKEIKILKAGK